MLLLLFSILFVSFNNVEGFNSVSKNCFKSASLQNFHKKEIFLNKYRYSLLVHEKQSMYIPDTFEKTILYY
jgi:hypothetical protein